MKAQFMLAPAIAVLALMASCSPSQVTTQETVPAGAPQVTTYKEVAVLPFDGVGPNGPEGPAFSAQLESALASIRVKEEPYFTVVDRQKVDSVMKEIAMGQSGAIDAGTAARIGQMTGAKAIYTGVVSQSRVSDEPYTDSKKDCSIDLKEGKLCRDVPVPCARRYAIFSATPKLIDVSTARIVYSRTITGSAVSQGCSGEGVPLKSADELLRAAQEDVLAKFQADVAPHKVVVNIPLLDMTEGIDAKKNKDRLDRGVLYAKRGRYDRACEEWLPAWNAEPDSFALAYDAGVCAELSGDLKEALKRYSQADHLYTGTGPGMMSAVPGINLADPITIIGDALARVKERQKKEELLSREAGLASPAQPAPGASPQR